MRSFSQVLTGETVSQKTSNQQKTPQSTNTTPSNLQETLEKLINEEKNKL